MSYGTDIYCYDRIVTGRLASGVEVVAQALYRRLTTARGTLRDGDEGLVYGLDVLDFVGQVGSEEAVDALPDVVLAEVLKDDRVERAEVSATIQRSSEGLVTILLDIDVFLHDSEETFTLSLSVSDVTVALLGVTTP
jgi:hypothetical protein